MPKNEDQLVDALDFGTTYSGIAYAFANDRKPEVVSIMDWPGLEGHSQPKVPTVICYDTESGSGFTWGGQKHKGAVIQGMKLLFDPDQARPSYLPKLEKWSVLAPLNKSAVEIAADYIGAIYKHVMVKIASKVPHDYLAMCEKKFVLSVPAVWSDKAKDRTLKAAENAGISPITLVKEPEAAAIYIFHHLQNKALSVGDAFIICDAGGGTVDLISYEITKLSPTLELKELVHGTGGMAGSIGLNTRFEQAVRKLVGEKAFEVLRKTKGFEQAMQQFDRSIKTAFRGDPEEDYYVNFPMAHQRNNAAKNLNANCWTMNGNDVEAIFQPLIADVERLVEEQVRLAKLKRNSKSDLQSEKIKAIFLVGGFGSSEYLKSRLEGLHPGVQVIQLYGAWGAIIKGAVLSKLPKEASIVSTQATRHYGVVYSATWKIHHVGLPKIWDAFDGESRYARYMTWYIYRGADIKKDQRIKFPFCRHLLQSCNESELVFKFALVQSEFHNAPTFPAKLATRTNCEVTSNLRSVGRGKFTKKVGKDGNNYFEVDCDLVITMQDALMKFSLEIDGEELGSVTANYDWAHLTSNVPFDFH